MGPVGLAPLPLESHLSALRALKKLASQARLHGAAVQISHLQAGFGLETELSASKYMSKGQRSCVFRAFSYGFSMISRLVSTNWRPKSPAPRLNFRRPEFEGN